MSIGRIWDKIIKGLAAALGAIAGLYGGWSAMLTVLVVMMGIDYLVGVLVALLGRSDKTENGGLSSKVGFVGMTWIDVDVHHFKAGDDMVVAGDDFLFPEKAAFQVHEAFVDHGGVYDCGMHGGEA